MAEPTSAGRRSPRDRRGDAPGARRGRLSGRTTRPRSSPTSPSDSASRCSSKAPPASARPSSPRRSSRSTGRELIRLQCYEGLDEAKALYEWNYRKQLLRIQAETGGLRGRRAPGEPFDEIFGEEFLLTRPLLTAIASPSRSSC